MPLLKHAKKKLRQDKKRTLQNKAVKVLYRGLLKDARKEATAENVSKAFQAIDKAAKHHLVHKNKAARLKSSLSKLLGAGVKPVIAAEKKVAKAVAKKAPAKKVTKKTAKK
jgi:small subunit ribosomal protein S20